ncbi:MAG: sulfurtransferase TusA family protein [Thermostichales cyanobacterium SZTDM-1c_bins_54]
MNLLDLRHVPCPVNLVRSRLYLQKQPPGSQVLIWLDQGDPLASVPGGLAAVGHRILETRYPDSDTAQILVEVKA